MKFKNKYGGCKVKNKDKTKTRPVSIRLSEEEFKALDKKAKQAGVKRHRLMKEIIRKAVGLATVTDVTE